MALPTTITVQDQLLTINTNDVPIIKGAVMPVAWVSARRAMVPKYTADRLCDDGGDVGREPVGGNKEGVEDA